LASEKMKAIWVKPDAYKRLKKEYKKEKGELVIKGITTFHGYVNFRLFGQQNKGMKEWIVGEEKAK